MTHRCHWPGCNRPVPPELWGCRRCWFGLPPPIRTRILRAYRKGQEITKTPSREYIEAAKAAQDWIAGKAPP